MASIVGHVRGRWNAGDCARFGIKADRRDGRNYRGTIACDGSYQIANLPEGEYGVWFMLDGQIARHHDVIGNGPRVHVAKQRGAITIAPDILIDS